MVKHGNDCLKLVDVTAATISYPQGANDDII